MSEEWKKEFFEWKDEIESKFNNLSQKHIELEAWKKTEEEQHQNITKTLDNFVIDAGAIGDSVYSNKLKSLENEIAELKKKGEKLEGKLSEWNKIMNISIMNNIDRRIIDLKKITDAQVIVNKDHSTGFNNLEEALRDIVIELLDKDIITIGRKQDFFKKLDSDPVQNRIDRLDAGFNILKKHEEGLKDVISKQAEKKDPWHDYEEVTDPITKVTVKIKKPYLDLGMITCKNGELSDYNPSQFVRDYAKTHDIFSLYGLMFPKEDSWGEKGQMPVEEPVRGVDNLSTLHSKPPEFLCTLKEQEQCDDEGSMDCLKGNSEGEYNNPDVCIHGKKELEKGG